MRLKNLLRVIVYGGSLALLLWAFWVEPASLRVREYELPLARWPQEQDGLRIALLSDLHAGAPYMDGAKLERIVALTLEAKPDLILLAGDYVINDIVGGRYMEPETIAAHLSGLRAPLGVYAVTGNHEHRRTPAQLHDAFERHGLRMIDGRLLRLQRGRFQFWLTGFDSLPDGLSGPARQIGLTYFDALPLIALSHNPEDYRLLKKPVRERIHLFLAGHTHGGQVLLPWIGPAMLRLVHEPVYVAGHYREESDLFVTSGIGTSNLPARFRVPPEISLLTLRHTP